MGGVKSEGVIVLEGVERGEGEKSEEESECVEQFNNQVTYYNNADEQFQLKEIFIFFINFLIITFTVLSIVVKQVTVIKTCR